MVAAGGASSGASATVAEEARSAPKVSTRLCGSHPSLSRWYALNPTGPAP